METVDNDFNMLKRHIVTSHKLRERGLQHGKAALYKIALAILYIDIDCKKKPETRICKINPKLLENFLSFLMNGYA